MQSRFFSSYQQYYFYYSWIIQYILQLALDQGRDNTLRVSPQAATGARPSAATNSPILKPPCRHSHLYWPRWQRPLLPKVLGRFPASCCSWYRCPSCSDGGRIRVSGMCGSRGSNPGPVGGCGHHLAVRLGVQSWWPRCSLSRPLAPRSGCVILFSSLW
jgi:hypothetical protein